MDQRGKDRIQDVIQAFADILRQKAQDEISVLLQQRILAPIPPVIPPLPVEVIKARLPGPGNIKKTMTAATKAP